VTNSLPTFVTGGINNMNFYSNERVDEIITELNGTFDAETQIELQVEMDRLLWEDFYGVTIFQFPSVTAYSDRVENIDPSIIAPTIFWNAWDWAVTDGGSEE
jgi:peptide/nickel transport system substrate-binding protein